MEKELATHSSILAWKIPWTEETGRLQSMGRKESATTEHILVPYRHNSMWFSDIQLIAVYIMSYYLYTLHII